MADPDRATCPRCGAPLAADNPACFCPGCLLSDGAGGPTEDPPVSPSSGEGARPKRTLTLALAVAAIGAILVGGLWFGNSWGQQPDYAEAHYLRGIGVQGQMTPEEAVAEFRTAVRLEPDDALAHYNLGIALKAQGKLADAVAEYRTAVRL